MVKETDERPSADPPRRRAPLDLVLDVTPSTPPPAFEQWCKGFGIELEPTEVDRLGLFLALLLENDQRMNLTAIREVEEAWERHIFDALTLLAVLHDLPEGARIVDLGSGGGVPALPLAIVLPQHHFCLVEATEKKAHFLRSAAQVLELSVEVLADRAEVVGHNSTFREKHDVAIARAVGSLRILVELGVPLIRPGGRCVFVKGARADEELADAQRALHLLHAEHQGTVLTPTGRLVVLTKNRKTPGRYPRRPGEPKRAPL